MDSMRHRIVMGALAAGIVALVAIGLWKTQGSDPLLEPVFSEPWGIMGTRTRLTAVVRADQKYMADEALREAEAALRDVQAKMDYRIEGSDIRRLNTAAEGEFVPMSPETLEVLEAARSLLGETDGAFDVTIGPILEVWIRAERNNALPTTEQLVAARERSNWEMIELHEYGAVRHTATVRVDLGGIAKGYGIDRAVQVLRDAGCTGGQVNVGGDLRCFGLPPDRGAWPVHVRNPFDNSAMLATLKIREGAVCTSGSYERSYKIGGQRYSHIVDPRLGPRTGMALPPDATPPSVTVVAPTAMIADGWATALSVLGTEGLRLIPRDSGIEAMVVTGSAENYTCRWTAGFEELLTAPPKMPTRPKHGAAAAIQAARP